VEEQVTPARRKVLELGKGCFQPLPWLALAAASVDQRLDRVGDHQFAMPILPA
jgi:hypothetical protein